jgi:glycosyltransferase involved in cell wall biosynthesis
MSSPLVTVTICTYNGEHYLKETLESVLAQNYSNFEVVIVDDGSQDSTLKIIKKYAECDSRIRWFSQKNVGLPASRNFAFSQSKGIWIAIIDQDDICYPDRLEKQVKVAHENPSADLIFCNTNYIDESGKVTGNHLRNFNVPDSFIKKGLASNLLLTQGCYVDSEACFIRRNVVQSLGKLDESLRYACDYEYFIRAGFVINFAYTTDILAAWRIHPKQLSYTDLNRFREIRRVLLRYFFHKELSYYTRTIILWKLGRMYASEVYHQIIFRLRNNSK